MTVSSNTTGHLVTVLILSTTTQHLVTVLMSVSSNTTEHLVKVSEIIVSSKTKEHFVTVPDYRLQQHSGTFCDGAWQLSPAMQQAEHVCSDNAWWLSSPALQIGDNGWLTISTNTTVRKFNDGGWQLYPAVQAEHLLTVPGDYLQQCNRHNISQQWLMAISNVTQQAKHLVTVPDDHLQHHRQNIGNSTWWLSPAMQLAEYFATMFELEGYFQQHNKQSI